MLPCPLQFLAFSHVSSPRSSLASGPAVSAWAIGLDSIKWILTAFWDGESPWHPGRERGTWLAAESRCLQCLRRTVGAAQWVQVGCLPSSQTVPAPEAHPPQTASGRVGDWASEKSRKKSYGSFQFPAAADLLGPPAVPPPSPNPPSRCLALAVVFFPLFVLYPSACTSGFPFQSRPDPVFL